MDPKETDEYFFCYAARCQVSKDTEPTLTEDWQSPDFEGYDREDDDD